jgi:myo-inositol catabolism protein IolC
MTTHSPQDAEVLRQQDFEAMEVRALRAHRRGRIRLLLEVNASRLASLLAADDDRQLYRCTEFDNEAELLSAFERAATALAR